MNNMSYESFCTQMQEKIHCYYGEETTVKLHNVKKINGVVLCGITVMKDGNNIMPTLYLEAFYEDYKRGTPIYELVRNFISEYEKADISAEFDISFFEEYEKVKPYLAYKLINYAMNESLLQEIPHEKFADLAVVCYCNVSDEKIGKGTILIRNEHIELWNKEREEVIRDAMENMPKLFPVELINMADLLRELYKDSEDILAGKLPMYVLTNKARVFGAAGLLYEEQLEKIAKEVQDDFYILPSSVHEVIILPKKYGTDEIYLSHMVDEINQEQLDREEVLSNHAYLYVRHTKEMIALPLVPYQKNSGNDDNECEGNEFNN